MSRRTWCFGEALTVDGITTRFVRNRTLSGHSDHPALWIDLEIGF